MKNQSLPTVIWWRSRSQKRMVAAKRFVEGFGMRALVPACHVGTITAFEQTKITGELGLIFCQATDQWFIAPICSPCHRRFTDLNKTDFGHVPEFEML